MYVNFYRNTTEMSELFLKVFKVLFTSFQSICVSQNILGKFSGSLSTSFQNIRHEVFKKSLRRFPKYFQEVFKKSLRRFPKYFQKVLKKVFKKSLGRFPKYSQNILNGISKYLAGDSPWIFRMSFKRLSFKRLSKCSQNLPNKISKGSQKILSVFSKGFQ